MKYPFIRRAAALALALFLALTLSIALTAPGRAAEDPGDSEGLKIKVNTEGAVKDGKLTLKPGETAELEAEWEEGKGPQEEDTKDIKYFWTCDNKDVTFDSNDDEEASTTTIKVGESAKAGDSATITVTVTWTPAETESGEQKATATYGLTIDTGTSPEPSESPDPSVSQSPDPSVSQSPDPSVSQSPDPSASPSTSPEPLSISFADSQTITRDPSRESLTVYLTGVDHPETAEITWTIDRQLNEPGTTKLPTLEGTRNGTRVSTSEKSQTITTTGTSVTVIDQSAGKFVITAKYGNLTATKYLVVSGIVLAWPDDKETVMTVGQNGQITWTAYGSADDANITKVTWQSSESSVAYVISNSGSVTARAKGTAVITATKGKYSATCTVRVEEDTSVIAEGYMASVSDPLTLDVVYRPRLENICEEKTRPAGKSDVKGSGSDLSYITNLKVSPTQGTLYYNYSTEADPGPGVGTSERFAWTASGTIRDVHKLFFVPKQGFIGTAEISFNGVAADGQNFTGIIRVTVTAGTGSGSGTYRISYAARAGEPVWFRTSDFDACFQDGGRSYEYIIFNLPKSSEGVLYYNYVAGSGNLVTTTTRFASSGRYTLDDVCFVPNAAYKGGSVIISFRGEDTSGAPINGEVVVSVTQPNTANDPANVDISGKRGRPVALQSNLFNDACREVLGDTLNFVTFKLPDPDEGALYVNYRGEGNYDDRVTAGTRCYFSGVPGLDSICFVPASGAVSRVAISYTGYAAGGASFSGVLYIDLDEENRSTIYYSVSKGGSVTLSAADFYNASLNQTGAGFSYVRFGSYSVSRGRLYCRRTSSSVRETVTASTRCYYSPTTSQVGLGRVYFTAEDTVGSVTIPYTSYNSKDIKLFEGEVVIQVGSPTPDDINLSCTAGSYAQLTSWALDSVCSEAMNASLSYIEITSVPDAKEGRLYRGYSALAAGTGTVVEPGARFYVAGSPGINELKFVPFARFTGEAEITYIGYSGDGQEQVSGRIVVKVSKSTNTSFDDMAGYGWAMDSVNYLYRNGTVQGDGTGRFLPLEIVRKCDFALMLVRAYGLTANGNVSFKDVPDDVYYADAVRITALLGIISGSDGYYNPTAPLTRQEAIVMIYNTLKVSGKAATNGLAADLSVYHDERSIDAGAKEAMGILVQMGVVEGDGGYLQPQRQLTRAEAAMLLHAIMTL